MTMTSDLTSTERLLFNLLSDGQPHSLHEMRGCLDDPFLEDNTLRVHIFNLRRKIRADGQIIVFERWSTNGRYRLSRQIVR